MTFPADERSCAVLARALHSPSKALRLRAVLMLSTVACARRGAWIESALEDPERVVREAAAAVASWVAEPATPPWPRREDIRHEADVPAARADDDLEQGAVASWEWEYAVEVWREDGLLIGIFLSTSCAEDDEHAKRMALGQAILSSADGAGDAFDPATAATFIVGKQRSVRPDAPRWHREGRRP